MEAAASLAVTTFPQCLPLYSHGLSSSVLDLPPCYEKNCSCIQGPPGLSRIISWCKYSSFTSAKHFPHKAGQDRGGPGLMVPHSASWTFKNQLSMFTHHSPFPLSLSASLLHGYQGPYLSNRVCSTRGAHIGRFAEWPPLSEVWGWSVTADSPAASPAENTSQGQPGSEVTGRIFYKGRERSSSQRFL